jgi:hypothetical protein
MSVYSKSVVARSAESLEFMRTLAVPKESLALAVHAQRETHGLTSVIDGPGHADEVIIEGTKVFHFTPYPEKSSIPSTLYFRDPNHLTPIVDSVTPAVMTPQASQDEVVITDLLSLLGV